MLGSPGHSRCHNSDFSSGSRSSSSSSSYSLSSSYSQMGPLGTTYLRLMGRPGHIMRSQ